MARLTADIDVTVELGRRSRVPVVCAEDLVAMKVLAGRPRDVNDVVTIITARGGDLDLQRIRTTLGLLERALDRGACSVNWTD